MATRASTVWRVSIEAVCVAGLGLALAFLANAVSPRGLSLSRNYFPGGTNGTVAAPTIVASSAETNSAANSEIPPAVAAALEQKNLQAANRDQVVKLFHDPRYEQGMVVFIDARDAEHYRAGHIPGALEFDPYRPENYLSTVLPACQAAEQIVVYCAGGDCEDSQFAAVTLRQAGIANEKLHVYPGGINDWTASGLPVESGERNSGNIRQTPK